MTKKTISTEEAKKKNLKPEWQPGGSKRQELLDKAVEYLKAPIMETQADRHHFCLNNLYQYYLMNKKKGALTPFFKYRLSIKSSS